jgi:hypothetical protein
MRQINLLPSTSFVEQYRWLFSISAALVLASIGIYYMLPYINQAWLVHILEPLPTASAATSKFAKHSIYKLRMVGYLSRGASPYSEQCWSVMQSSDGEVSTVKISDYIGYEGAQVTDIKPTGIYLLVQ